MAPKKNKPPKPKAVDQNTAAVPAQSKTSKGGRKRPNPSCSEANGQLRRSRRLNNIVACSNVEISDSRSDQAEIGGKSRPKKIDIEVDGLEREEVASTADQVEEKLVDGELPDCISEGAASWTDKRTGTSSDGETVTQRPDRKNRKTGKGAFLNFRNKRKQMNPKQKLDKKVALEMWKALTEEEKQQYFVDVKPPTSSLSVKNYTSRCSPKRFIKTVSGFSEEQMAACEATGFGDLIKMKGMRLHKLILRQLIHSANIKEGKIIIKIHRETLEITSDHFASAMGLRNVGLEVSFEGLAKDYPELVDLVQEFFDDEKKSMLSVSKVEAYLKKKEAPADDKFKQVFVLYTMSTILAPSASLLIPQKWLLLLRDTSTVNSYNWAQFGFDQLSRGIIELKKKQTYISGCILFLQLFYFSVVDLPIKNISQKIPVEAWEDKKAQQAQLVIDILKKKEVLLSSDSTKLRKNQDRVCARGETSDPKLTDKIARLEAARKMLKSELEDETSRMLDRILNAVAARKMLESELEDETSKKLDRILNAVLAKQSQDDGDTSSNNEPHFNKYGTAGDAQNKEFAVDVEIDGEAILDYVYGLADDQSRVADCNGQYCTKRGAMTLLPKAWINEEVVNVFSMYQLVGCTDKSVYFHSYFNVKAKAYYDGVILHDKLPTLKSLGISFCAPFISTCEKIFIPVHDEDHWYVFIVRIDNETGEYWDSLGDSKSRRSHCKEVLKIFDLIFGDMVKKNKKFEDFPIFKPLNCPEQKDYSDCGVYTIKHMIHYGEEWWHEYNSKEVRRELTLKLLCNKYNSCRPLLCKEIKRLQKKETETEKK